MVNNGEIHVLHSTMKCVYYNALLNACITTRYEILYYDALLKCMYYNTLLKYIYYNVLLKCMYNNALLKCMYFNAL